MTKLTRNLERILKNCGVPGVEIPVHVEAILKEFTTNGRFLKYSLNLNSYIILTKDERTIQHLRRYRKSPFPLLSNIERFSNTIGRWNDELMKFGIKSRAKYDDPSELSLENLGTRVHLVYYNTPSFKGNQYLLRQYKLLSGLRRNHEIASYWDLSWTLMRKSWSFRIASLNSWKPRWYKTLTTQEVKTILTNLNKILNFEELKTSVYNVWIESPRGKWRQLGVPNKPWRLYLHMVNMFISYIYEPRLKEGEYEGFIFNRGCKSWWENLLWGDLLSKFHSLVEVDLSSGFPNLSRETLMLALKEDGLIPPSYIQLILTHLSSPLIGARWFPNFESYIEHQQNKAWREGNRSVHMGLGISPILFVITLSWSLRKIKFLNPHLQMKWYADDGSFYFNLRGLYQLLRSQKKDLTWALREILGGRNLFLSLLNELESFQRAGLKLCRKKSSLVRIFGIWLKPYISLGLKLYTNWGMSRQILNIVLRRPIPLELMGWTRGRGENPVKGLAGTLPSRRKLEFPGTAKDCPEKLDLTTMLKGYKKYFGLLISLLYASKPPEAPSPTATRLLKLSKNSLLWKILNGKKQRNLNKRSLKLDIYNSGCKLTGALLSVNKGSPLDSDWTLLYPNIERELKIKWEVKARTIYDLELNHPIRPSPPNSRADWDYFKKYSEIQLSPSELEKGRELYELQGPRVLPTGMPSLRK